MLKIGGIELKTPVVAAPMAGITDAAFRTVLSDEGAGMVTTEMVSAKGLLHKNRNNRILMQKGEADCPTALQLFGSDPLTLARAAESAADDFDIIDINMGCPVPKIVKNGEGSALMLDPGRAFGIVDTLVRVLPEKTVTVKMRLGFDEAHINAVEFAKMLESAGVSAITLHARTRSRMYSGHADWGMIGKVKEAIGIPLIGNGDIYSAADALRMMRETGADGAALGRGLRGRPWLMGQCVRYLADIEAGAAPGLCEPEEPAPAEKKRYMLRHIELMERFKGGHITVLEMRKHLGWYIGGMPGAREMRTGMNELSSVYELVSFVNSL